MDKSSSAQQKFKWIIYPLVMTNSLLLNMTIYFVDFPIENGDFL